MINFQNLTEEEYVQLQKMGYRSTISHTTQTDSISNPTSYQVTRTGQLISHEDRVDAVADALADAYELSLEGREISIPYFRGMAKNKSRNIFRSRVYQDRYCQQYAAIGSFWEDTHEKEYLPGALTEKIREIPDLLEIANSMMEGYSITETSQKLGIPRRTVTRRVKILRQIMEEWVEKTK